MKKFLYIALLIILISPSAFAKQAPESFADLVEKLTPAVVNISTTQRIKSRAIGQQGLGMFFDMLPNDPNFDPFNVRIGPT